MRRRSSLEVRFLGLDRYSPCPSRLGVRVPPWSKASASENRGRCLAPRREKSFLASDANGNVSHTHVRRRAVRNLNFAWSCARDAWHAGGAGSVRAFDKQPEQTLGRSLTLSSNLQVASAAKGADIALARKVQCSGLPHLLGACTDAAMWSSSASAIAALPKSFRRYATRGARRAHPGILLAPAITISGDWLTHRVTRCRSGSHRYACKLRFVELAVLLSTVHSYERAHARHTEHSADPLSRAQRSSPCTAIGTRLGQGEDAATMTCEAVERTRLLRSRTKIASSKGV